MKAEIVRFVVRFACEAGHEPDGVEDFVRPDPASVANDALGLLRLASQHKRECELWSSVNDGRDHDALTDKLERQMIDLLRPYGIGLAYQHDPRGCTVKLKLPSGYTDDVAREGFRVPQQGLSARQLEHAGR